MARVEWDRLLETCVKQGQNALLMPGFSFLLRTPWGLQAANLEPMSEHDIAAMLVKLRPKVERGGIPGYGTFDVTHQSDHQFRITVLGSPRPLVVSITLLPKNAPAVIVKGEKWKAVSPHMSWPDLLARCVGGAPRDAILVRGCPPLMWSEWAVHAFGVSPLTPKRIGEMVKQIIQPPERRFQAQGHFGFDVPHGDTDHFRAAVFGSPAPNVVLLMRLPQAAQPR